MADPNPVAPWKLHVADGSANAYHLECAGEGQQVSFKYVPVTPEQSSTGMYSGGSPREESLAATDARLDALWKTLYALDSNEAVHVADRAKGTGAIAWENAKGKHDFIVKRGPELDALLAQLEAFGQAPK